MENANITSDPVVYERMQELREDWTRFSKGLNGWKHKIESDLKKSKEYETVLARAESVVVDLNKKKNEQNSSQEDLDEVCYRACYFMICLKIIFYYYLAV